MGDPAGIGPEVCLQAIASQQVQAVCNPIVFGDVFLLQRVARALDLNLPARTLSEHDELPFVDEPAVLHLPGIDAAAVQPGRVDQSTGRAAYTYIDAALQAATSGRVDAITTGPIHKEALQLAGVRYPGHTEILLERTGTKRGCMMLTSDEVTCSVVTGHVGLRDVFDALTVDRILEVIELSDEAMRQLRGHLPRLVVCGLNPHAGEHGLFGRGEEEALIEPAIELARARGIQVDGPVPPDTAFLPARRASTDCFVCMYHDQGLIPLKALAFDDAVNVTLGLPIVRTSVDHGTACEIAWQGKASYTSMVAAITLAVKLIKKQS